MIMETYRVKELNEKELLTIEGGDFFDDLVYGAGYVTGVVVGSALVAVHRVGEAIL